jgi:hypothetical protein
MGSLLAFVVYSILKWLEYQSANPGQDADDLERAITPTSSPPATQHQKTSHHRNTFSEANDGTLPPRSKPTTRSHLWGLEAAA